MEGIFFRNVVGKYGIFGIQIFKTLDKGVYLYTQYKVKCFIVRNERFTVFWKIKNFSSTSGTNIHKFCTVNVVIDRKLFQN